MTTSVAGLASMETTTRDRSTRFAGSFSPFRWVLSGHADDVEVPTPVILPDFSDDSLEQFLLVDTVTHSLRELYVSEIARLGEVERIFWRRENERIRVWTVINEPDESVEEHIADVELGVMDMRSEYSFDFTVIYRQGRPHGDFNPLGAILVYSKD